ncbi:NAD-dependent epimerase/dehydratase family protein [Magnetococcales bacterium HHB-1]
MGIAIITGAAGLIGSEAVRFFIHKGLEVVGIDNDMRQTFFGKEASTRWNQQKLQKHFSNYIHHDVDIRDPDAIGKIFQHYGQQIEVIVHCAAQPSHDWAAKDPLMDFTVNANGTLVLLESTRQHCPDAVFIHLSTNKVYGDTPNFLPLVEQEKRWEIAEDHPYFAQGIDENMSLDHCKHSLFGVSKASADLMVQEYGRYFGMKTACFRGGCLTGPAHSGTELHGFLAYLMLCTVQEKGYTVFGYKGKQVRDNIHSHDLVSALWHFYKKPKAAAVYNMGGGRFSNCSMLEAIDLCQKISQKELQWKYAEDNRIGDHIWWISDTSRFQQDYPEWKQHYPLEKILQEIHDALKERASM